MMPQTSTWAIDASSDNVGKRLEHTAFSVSVEEYRLCGQYGTAGTEPERGSAVLNAGWTFRSETAATSRLASVFTRNH